MSLKRRSEVKLQRWTVCELLLFQMRSLESVKHVASVAVNELWLTCWNYNYQLIRTASVQCLLGVRKQWRTQDFIMEEF